MTAHAEPLPAPAPPAELRAAGGLRLLTWPALDAAGVDMAVTARDGGVSTGPYASLNLSLTVGDDPARVLENRRRLASALGASPGDFIFARQVHGAGVRIVGEADRGSGAFTVDDAIPDTDALVTTTPGVVLAILTADCVPIVLHDPVAGILACVHAGWRGTVARVAAAAVAAMTSLGSRPSDIIAGLGPAADPARYQVGPDVHHALTQAFPSTAQPASAQPVRAETAPAQTVRDETAPAQTVRDETVSAQTASTQTASAQTASPAEAFLRPDPSAPGHWLLDLWSANRHVLLESGLRALNIHSTNLPTGPTSSSHFFSDRAARPCGRLALVSRLRVPGQPPMAGAL